MTDRISGLSFKGGQRFPIAKRMTDNTETKTSRRRVPMKKPEQAEASRRPANPTPKLKSLNIPKDNPLDERAHGKKAGLDGNLSGFGIVPQSKRSSSRQGGRGSQRSSQSASAPAVPGFNDEEVGAAAGFLQALLGGGFQPREGQPEPRGARRPAPSVPAQDPALPQAPPPGAANANAVPITGGRL